MVTTDPHHAIYWDASAILSVLFQDNHSDSARSLAQKQGFHLISTLAYIETCAVIARIGREGILADVLIQAAFEQLRNGPWRHLTFSPDLGIARSLSTKWPIRGADLWHLATAKSLQDQLPELILLTFDIRLKEAAEGEGLFHEEKQEGS
jgi:predicted nucleic acid-binding protein